MSYRALSLLLSFPKRPSPIAHQFLLSSFRFTSSFCFSNSNSNSNSTLSSFSSSSSSHHTSNSTLIPTEQQQQQESHQEPQKHQSYQDDWWSSLIGFAFGLATTAMASTTILFGKEMIDKEEQTIENEDKPLHPKVEPVGNVRAPIFKIVLTGGPCGGKSTALAHLKRHFNALGFRVYNVPEAATLLFSGGSIMGASSDSLTLFQTNLIKLQMALEDTFTSLAKSRNEPSVVLCDRGTMDSSAYVPPELWEIILEEQNWSTTLLRDKRYDAVIHLVSAANGAEKYYTTENNTTRLETLEEARALDFKLLNAWVGHPHLRIIDNSTDFQGKVQRVVSAICQVVGVPVPAATKRRFLIADGFIPPLSAIPGRAEEFEIEQRFLKTLDGSEARITTRRGKDRSATYDYSVKRVVGDHYVVLERPISGREFAALTNQADQNHTVVKKKLWYFLYANQSFTLHFYVWPVHATILEINTELPDQEVKLPPFLHVVKEVTNDPHFTGFHMSVNHTIQSEK